MALVGGGWVGGSGGGWVGGSGGGWVGGSGGGWASQRRVLFAIRPHRVLLCSQQTTEMYTNHRIDQDSRWQQFSTQPILISALLANRPCNPPNWLYRVGKKPSMKADLAIYSHALEVSGRCMSVFGFWILVLVRIGTVFANLITVIRSMHVAR